VTLFVNGTQVYAATCCVATLTNVWSGFLGASTTVEFQIVNTGGPGNLQVTIGPGANPITVTPPVTICSTSSTVLTASSALPLTFAWTPTTGLTPGSGLGATVAKRKTLSSEDCFGEVGNQELKPFTFSKGLFYYPYFSVR
jgi:hypothetical protein